MSRKKRKKAVSGIYHVIWRGNDQQNIFLDDEDRNVFLHKLRKYTGLCRIEIYTYALMDNHVHILLKDTNNSISDFMKRLGISYVFYFNSKYERTGHLFQERFRSEPVETEKYLKVVTRYILQNPQKAGICNFTEYRWNNLSDIIKERNSKYKFIIDLFDGIENFLHFISLENNDQCLSHETKYYKSDNYWNKIITSYLKIRDLQKIKKLKNKKELLALIKKKGIPIRQLSRLTGISRKEILNA